MCAWCFHLLPFEKLHSVISLFWILSSSNRKKILYIFESIIKVSTTLFCIAADQRKLPCTTIVIKKHENHKFYIVNEIFYATIWLSNRYMDERSPKVTIKSLFRSNLTFSTSSHAYKKRAKICLMCLKVVKRALLSNSCRWFNGIFLVVDFQWFLEWS